LIVLKTYDQQFTLTTKKPLHIIFKIAHSQNAGTDFDTKYVKRRGSAQECAFSGSQNQNLTFRAFVPPKPFWDPILMGLGKFSPKRLL